MPGFRIVGAAAVLTAALPGDLRQRSRNGNRTLAQSLRSGPDSLFYDVSRKIFHVNKYIYLSDIFKKNTSRKKKDPGVFSIQGEIKAKNSAKNFQTLRRW